MWRVGIRRQRRAIGVLVVIATLAAVVDGGGEFSMAAGSPLANSAPPARVTLAADLPDSPAGHQLGWVIAVAQVPPVPAAAIRQHFDANFLAKVPPSELNSDLVKLRARSPWRIVALDAGTDANVLFADVVSGGTRFGLDIAVDSSGLISVLYVSLVPQLPAEPTNWTGVDEKLRSLAPDVSFEAARIAPSGVCMAVNAISPTVPRPLASMFKLYVLEALARAIASGRLTWQQSVRLSSSLRSLPSGLLQTEPAGTRVSVLELAELMISSSDNTAADELASLVGRSAVESAVAATSKHAALDFPFLHTREHFVLKYADYPKYANAYLSLRRSARLSYLTRVVDKVPLSAINLASASQSSPRDIDSIEWFASPGDLCSIFSLLYHQSKTTALAPIGAVMSIDDGGLALSSSSWPTVWFKGGSEAGVFTLGYLATDARGGVDVVTLELSSLRATLEQTSLELDALATIRGAFALLS